MRFGILRNKNKAIAIIIKIKIKTLSQILQKSIVNYRKPMHFICKFFNADNLFSGF